MTSQGNVNTDLLMSRGRYAYVDVGQRIADLRREFGKRHGRRLTQRELAGMVGVSEGTVTAWEIGKQRPEGNNLLRLAEVLDSSPGAILSGNAATPSEHEPFSHASDQTAAELLMEHYEGMVRQMGGAGVAPEELQLRKRDVIEGLKRLHAAAGGVPAWVYELEGRIERGEL